MKKAGMVGLAAMCVVVWPSLRGSAVEDKVFSFKDTPGQYLDILRDGQVAGRYMYAYDRSTKDKCLETYKTYLHVFDAEGKAPVTKGAGGDFTHHRGIFIGWAKLSCNGKMYDRWHMKGGEQIHRKFTLQEADSSHASFTSLVDWTDESGKPLVTEERTMTFRRAPAPAYQLIDFVSQIKAVGGDVVLDGDREHAGIQFRPANEVEKLKTVYTFPGRNVDPQKNHDLQWIAETFSLNGKSYSAVEMNHLDNPKTMQISAHRNYGRFGYFPKTEIKKGEVCTFKFRFLVAEGEMPKPEMIQNCANEFTGRSDPVPEITVKPAEQPVEKAKESKGVEKSEKKH